MFFIFMSSKLKYIFQILKLRLSISETLKILYFLINIFKKGDSRVEIIPPWICQ